MANRKRLLARTRELENEPHVEDLVRTSLRFPRRPLEIVLVLVITLEALALAEWLSYPYWVSGQLFGDVETGLFKIASYASPLLVVGLLYLSLLRVLVQTLIQRSGRLASKLRSTLPQLARVPLLGWTATRPPREFPLTLRRVPLLLLALAAISALLVYTPYRSDVNPTGELVGVDTPLYVDWVTHMLQRPLVQALSFAFDGASQGSRPLFLTLLYSIASARVQPFRLLESLPLLMAPLLSLSTWQFARSGGDGEGMATLAALLTSFSFTVTVGMWAGYYANWFAMIETYLFYTSLLGFLRRLSLTRYLPMIGVSMALFLTHPWTWLLVLVAAFLFVLGLRREMKSNLPTLAIASAILIGLVVDILKNVLVGGETVASDLATKGPVFGLSQLSNFGQNLSAALLETYGGLLSNALVISLALLAIPVLKHSNPFQRLLLFWVATASVPFLFLDSFHQTRIVYDLPIPVLASYGLFTLMARIESRAFRVSLMILLFVILFNANYALRSMFQL